MSYYLEEKNRITENIMTGISELDNITSGCRKSELIVIGSEVNRCNSPLLITILRNIICVNKMSAIYFSLQQSKYSVTSFLISNASNIEVQMLRNGKLNPSEVLVINQVIEEIEKTLLYIDDSSELSVSVITDRIYKQISEIDRNINAIFIDGLNFMNYDGELCMHSDKALELTLLGLKSLAKKNEVPVFVTYQMDNINRPNNYNNKRPKYTDLFEKNKLFHIADIIWLIYQPEYYQIVEDDEGNSLIGKAEIITTGNHAYGIAKVAFNSHLGKIEDIQKPLSEF
jgi:replicative DNA helicase